MVGMVKKRTYREIKFVMVENLKGRTKEIAKDIGINEGLAALKISIDSPPQYEIIPITENPIEFVKKLAKEDGIEQSELDRVLASAFGEKSK